MPKIVVIARCKDQAKWEAGFKTHVDLFRNEYGVTKPVEYGMADDNSVIACFESDDLQTAMKALENPATAEAMESDGLLRESVKIFVLDKEVAVS